jgi:hypothetical protein
MFVSSSTTCAERVCSPSRRVDSPGIAEPAHHISILGFHARVSGTPALVEELPALYPPLPAWAARSGDAIDARYRVECDAPSPGWYQITRDGQSVWSTAHREEFLPGIESLINRVASAQMGAKYLCLHAGAVARDGRGFLLPAAAGSGKTTLVAGLLARGFQYLTDDVAVLERTTGHLLPFGRSLAVKAGAREALAPLYPGLAGAPSHRRPDGERVWYLPPPVDVWPAAPMPVRFVILPRYAPGAG